MSPAAYFYEILEIHFESEGRPRLHLRSTRRSANPRRFWLQLNNIEVHEELRPGYLLQSKSELSGPTD